MSISADGDCGGLQARHEAKLWCACCVRSHQQVEAGNVRTDTARSSASLSSSTHAAKGTHEHPFPCEQHFPEQSDRACKRPRLETPGRSAGCCQPHHLDGHLEPCLAAYACGQHSSHSHPCNPAHHQCSMPVQHLDSQPLSGHAFEVVDGWLAHITQPDPASQVAQPLRVQLAHSHGLHPCGFGMIC